MFSAAAVNIIFLAASSFILASSKIFSEEIVLGVIIAADVTSAFTGGYIAARIKREKGMICGAIVGGMLFIGVLIGSLICGCEEITFRTAISLGVLLIFGALGGIKGVNRKARIKIK